MKKKILLLLVMILALQLVGCNKFIIKEKEITFEVEEVGEGVTAVPLKEFKPVFLDKETATEVLAAEDDYILNLTEFDYLAKFNSDRPLTQEERAVFYGDVVLEFTEEEKLIIEKAFVTLNDKVKELNLICPSEISFIKTNGKEEGGAAYTRGKAVVFSTSILNNTDDLTRLVAHEFFHVYSRYNKEQRAAMYEIIGFKEADGIEYPEEIVDLRISNPDAPDIKYYFEDEYDGEIIQFVPMIYANQPYNEHLSRNFFDYLELAGLGVYIEDGVMKPLREENELILANLYKLPTFLDQTGRNTSYLFHPEEILADNFEKYVSGSRLESQWVVDQLIEIISNNK